MKTINLNLLNRKYFILSLAILLVNDFYLKVNYSNWLTGKLSDFAGLFIFPYFCSVFFKGKPKLIYILTAIGFVFWKSPYSQMFIDFSNQYLPIHISRVVDYTDFISLLILPISYYYLTQKYENNTGFNILKAIIIALTSLFAFSATTCNKEAEPEFIDSTSTEMKGLLYLKSNINKTVLTNKYPNIGIVLTDGFEVYDRKKNNVIHYYSADDYEMVAIDSISQIQYKFSDNDEDCDKLYFVKIFNSQFSGWVYSDYLYELKEPELNTNYSSKGINFRIQPTKNFLAELDSFYCGNEPPIVLYNSKFNKNECIIIKGIQEVYAKGYFTLESHDEWNDIIKKIKYENDNLILNIEREHQEGYEDIILKININNKQSFAEVISVTKHK